MKLFNSKKNYEQIFSGLRSIKTFNLGLKLIRLSQTNTKGHFMEIDVGFHWHSAFN